MTVYLREKDVTVDWVLKGGKHYPPYIEVWVKWRSLRTNPSIGYIDVTKPLKDEIESLIKTLLAPQLRQLNNIYHSVLEDRRVRDCVATSVDISHDLFTYTGDDQPDIVDLELPEILQPIVDKAALEWFEERFADESLPKSL